MRFISSSLAILASSFVGFGVSSVVLTSTVNIAYAQTNSQIAGVKVPKGGTAFGDITDRYKTLLTEVAKSEAVSRAPKDVEPEVFIWQGANYREDRISLTKGAFASALETAGYTSKEVEGSALGEVNLFSIFPAEEELPFNPEVWKQHSYLVAENKTTKQAFVAGWLQGAKALTLGILPINYVAPRGPAKWSTGTNTVVIKNWKNASAGLPATKLPTFPTLSRKPGVALGWLKDASGKPIANAEVVAESSFGGGLKTNHKARSNAQGLYEILIPRGVARVVSAEVKKTYNGQTFTLPLMPVRGEAQQFNSTQGQIKNFVLKTRGEEYGGTLRLLTNVPEKSEVEVTLTPVGPLLDGTAGKTFVYRYTASPYEENYIGGLPIGRYKCTARLSDEGDVIPLRVAMSYGSEADRAYRSNLMVDFKPGYTYSNIVQSNMGVQHFEVLIKP